MLESAGKPWTTLEIEAVVADYLDMLRAELTGSMVVKAMHNRALQVKIGRSKGSIEYKHQNISAVLEKLGLPFIKGYKPARHYQRALFEVTLSRLAENGLYETLSGTKEAGTTPYRVLPYEVAPKMEDEPEIDDPDIRRIIRKFDPAERDARNRFLGEKGEAFLFQVEQDWLSTNGRDDLAAKVRWVSKEDGDGAGYDILSFSRHGEERWLEVKTTNGPSTTPFWLSENERRVSEKHRDVFRLVRVYDFSRRPTAYRLKPPLSDKVRLVPTQYRAGF